MTGAAPGERVSLIFDPLRFAEEQQSLFGVVHGAEGVFTPDAQLDVYRGRFGGKPSEQLRLLGHVAPDVLNWPRARWAGFTKGAATALAEMSTAAGAAQPMLCWLALQLAMYGFVQRKDAAMAAQAYGPVTLAPQGPVIPVGSLLVWRDYLSRQCDELDGRLRELQRRNPFINGATREQVQRWLKLEQPELAGRILREFCERSGLRVGRTLLGPVVRLGKLHEAVAPRDFSTAQTILRRVHEDQLTNKHALQTAYPAQQHLAAWLLDAGMLVDCGGYYFTREDLLHALDLLHVKKANIATAGVRDIKDVLEYPRRKAEALRAFIVQHFGTGGEADTAPHGAGR